MNFLSISVDALQVYIKSTNIILFFIWHNNYILKIEIKVIQDNSEINEPGVNK